MYMWPLTESVLAEAVTLTVEPVPMVVVVSFLEGSQMATKRSQLCGELSRCLVLAFDEAL